MALAVGLLLEDDPDPARTGVVAALLIAAVVLLVIRPADIRSLATNLRSVKTPFVEAEFGAAALDAPPEETEKTPDDPDAAASRDILDLRRKLEAKLAYIVKHLLGEYATVGSLGYDGYLTDDESAVATRILTLRDEDLQAWSPVERDRFLTAADGVVGGIRGSVHRAMVCKRLEENGWLVDDDSLPASLGRRPDLQATKDGRVYRIVPVFTTTQDSKLLPRARERLAAAEAPEPERRVVVVPDRPGSPTVDEHPRAVKLSQLPDLIRERTDES
jgi:hypothetical protein